MATSNKRSKVRKRILEAFRRELMGPSDPNEVIKEYPTTRYIVGRLAPSRESEEDTDGAISSDQNEALGAGADDDEAGSEEPLPSLIIGFNPSSIGLSFLVDPETSKLQVKVQWGDYKREKFEEDGTIVWKRYPREGIVTGISVNKTGPLPQIPLSDSDTPSGISVKGIDDPEITLEGVVHKIEEAYAVSLFIVNRRTKGKVTDRWKDERWLMQPKIEVKAADDNPAFLAKGFLSNRSEPGDDPELAISNLLYRFAREFSTGHGVAAGWTTAEGGLKASCVYTDYIPEYEVPNLVAPAEQAGRAILDMMELSLAGTSEELFNWLEPLIVSYESWIKELEVEAKLPEITRSQQLSDAAKVSIKLCWEAVDRMREGLNLLRKDRQIFEAFTFANHVMWDQRIHSLWASNNQKHGEVRGSSSDYDKPHYRTWRPFQIGFILMNLRGMADDFSSDRRVVDLLWFPTGGGKTEAYLGLSAFTLALRRLRRDRQEMTGGAGVSIIMRYTLRLLTVQQFQRAAALIAACEVSRREEAKKWGEEPFKIGLWVGRGTTPNTAEDSFKALEDLYSDRVPREGSPVQIVSCPRCGTSLVTERGRPENQTYIPDKAAKRTLICCRNPKCEFCARKSENLGLPVVVVDDEIYRTCPSLLVATVDKFARLPFKGETQALFGLRNRFSPTYGHLTPAHGDKVSGRKIRDAISVPRLLPPDLIIQDELHLISGPLGTLVGLYETSVDYLTRLITEGSKYVPCKVISSTATIRRASQQVRQLYARQLSIFPPNGLSAGDSFFAKERPIDLDNDETAGRLYVGVNAPGSSTKTLLVRVYSALLAAAQAEIDNDAASADPFGSLVGYFNSLRALGGAKRLVEDDIGNKRLKYLHRQRGFPLRNITQPEELTSRLDSWKIPGLLKKLDIPFPRGKTNWPVDVLLATNMISVGVDIDRLGLIVVTGQPKTSAEYIQATSRIGRMYPGLVVTMYNWLGARDLSHYERFHSYHSALYRFVEAISVTPFSSRALDRGLYGVFAAMNRLIGPNMAQEPEAANFDPSSQLVDAIIDELHKRAVHLVGKANAELVRERLLKFRDDWARFSDELLRYSWLRGGMPPDNSRVLLRTLGSNEEGEWPVPGSLREIEQTAAFFLTEEEK